MKNIYLVKVIASWSTAVFLSLVFINSVYAAVPNTVNYQGYLTDSSDVPIDATENITFSIYDAATAGTLLWTETESVTIVDGKFNNQLGDSVLFPPTLFNGQALYVGITVGTDTEMSPRKPLTSAPYAFKSATADSASQADNATTLDGNTAAELDQSAHVSDTANPHSVTAAQVGAATSADITTHAEDVSAHHAKYSDAEAVIAMGITTDLNTLNHSKYTNADSVAAVLAADGTGSNLDADLLDGLQASEIIDAAGGGVDQGIISNGQIFDIEGNAYKVVTIGTQTWMGESLRTTTYNDGEKIPNLSQEIPWRVAIEMNFDSYAWYDNDENYKYPWGALYNGVAVVKGKLCPTGWHVPSVSEFDLLIGFVGGQTIAGGKLKSTGNISAVNGLWLDNFSDGTDDFGFSASPSGYRFSDGRSLNLNRNSYYWTTTLAGTNTNNFRGMSFINASSTAGSLNHEHGLSVRCMQD